MSRDGGFGYEVVGVGDIGIVYLLLQLLAADEGLGLVLAVVCRVEAVVEVTIISSFLLPQ